MLSCVILWPFRAWAVAWLERRLQRLSFELSLSLAASQQTYPVRKVLHSVYPYRVRRNVNPYFCTIHGVKYR